MSSYAEKQMLDLAALYASDEYLADINVIARMRGNVASDVAAAVAMATPPFKTGAVIWITKPRFVDKKPNEQAGPMELQWEVHVIAYPLLNDDTENGGSGKQAFDLARRVALITKNYRSGGLTQNFTVEGITPGVEGLEDESTGEKMFTDGWAVKFRGNEGDFGAFVKCAPVVISPREGAAPQSVTLTCATGGAEIYYTLDADLSHPWSGNGAATLYTGAITVGAAGVLRARAHKSGCIGSDVAAANFT